MERKRLSKPLLYLSSYIEQHKGDYYGLLQRIRTHGEWSGWLRYFLTAVRDTARSAIDQSQGILKLREKYRKKLAKQHRAMTLLDELFVNPYTTIARSMESLGVTAPTAAKTIGQLEKAGMLAETTGKGWGRVWVARPILTVVQKTPHFGTET